MAHREHRSRSFTPMWCCTLTPRRTHSKALRWGEDFAMGLSEGLGGESWMV